MSTMFSEDDIDITAGPTAPSAPESADDIDIAMPTIGLTPAQAAQVAEAVRDLDAVAPIALVSTQPLAEVLPPDFPLPTLIRFVPNLLLKQRAEQATAYALSIDVTGTEGLGRADLALGTLREAQKAIEANFAEPTEIANHLHKRLTGLRAEWLAEGKAAIDTVGRRVWAEERRIEEVAAAERRKAQEAANAEARRLAQMEAEAAAKNQAPPQIVEELQRRVETATAPPVPVQTAAPAMRSTSTITTWKARPKGTAADVDPNPAIAEMSDRQRECVKELLRAILDGTAPITTIEVNYSYLNSRAKGDKATFNIPGFEAFEDGGVRAKGTRGRR